jgi:hypothetical protein
LLVMSLSPCCPYHPAGVSCRLGQPAPCHAAFAPKEGARPPDLSFVSRPLMGSLSLRPGDLLTIPKMALSVGFIRFVFSTDATQAKGLLAFTPVGLPPTEHVCLFWTHSFVKIPSGLKMAKPLDCLIPQGLAARISSVEVAFPRARNSQFHNSMPAECQVTVRQVS